MTDDSSPISVIYHAAASIITTNAQYDVTCPDPSPYLRDGDIVLYACMVMNGFQDVSKPNLGIPVGGGSPYFANDGTDASRNNELHVVARRIVGSPTIAAADRRFSFYINFTQSTAIATTLVLRGAAGSAWNDGLQPGTYLTNEFGADYQTQDAAVLFSVGTAPERSVIRANPKSLAIAQHFTITGGAMGPAPTGWERGLEYQATSGIKAARVLGEYRYFDATGTTTTVARNPRPPQGNHATLLMHVFAD